MDDREKLCEAIMEYYVHGRRGAFGNRKGHGKLISWAPNKRELEPIKWARKQRALKGWDAVEFFIGIMLCHGQSSMRAWAAAYDFIGTCRGGRVFADSQPTTRTIWEYIANADLDKIKGFYNFKSNETGYTDSYLLGNVDEFASALQKNAQKIDEDYGLVEFIWEDDLPDDYSEVIEKIRERFLEFELIDEERANIAVWLLVRDYGYAGGVRSRMYFNLRYNEEVARVILRAFFAENDMNSAKEYAENLERDLGSGYYNLPPEFDLALQRIGRDWCSQNKPKCKGCPIRGICRYVVYPRSGIYDMLEKYWSELEKNWCSVNGIETEIWEQGYNILEGEKAIRFFIGIMLCRGQSPMRAWAAAYDFVATYEGDTKQGFWENIAAMEPDKLKNFCMFKSWKRSYNAFSYGGWYASDIDEFVRALQKNARKISNDYFNNVESIWEYGMVEEIRKKFLEFELIDIKQANMAVLLLVRDYGCAGGVRSRRYFNMRYNKDVVRVIKRAFLDEELDEELNKGLTGDEERDDFLDLALLQIGKDYCYPDDPNCMKCPIREYCIYHIK